MSKFKLDLSKFKKMKDEGDYCYMQSPEGHEFRIAKKALSKSMRDSLDKLEVHMSQGGMVPAMKENYDDGQKKKKKDKGPYIDPKAAKEIEEGATSSGWRPDEWKKNIKSALGYAEGGEVEGDNPEPVALNLDMPTQMGQLPLAQNLSETLPDRLPGSQPFGTPDPTEQGVAAAQQAEASQAEQGLAQPMAAEMASPTPQPQAATGGNRVISGIRQEEKALSQQAKEQEAALKAQAMAANKLMESYTGKLKELDNERTALQADIQASQIDPQRYLGNMSTGAKMATMFGLILGGFGSGMAGRENEVAKMLDKDIERDIDAQKAQLNKKETLLSANMKQYGNLKDATDMTRVMMNDMAIAQLKMAAAKAQNPLAKANAEKMIGQMEAQQGALTQQMAVRQALSSGNISPEEMPAMIQQLEAIDPKAAKEMRDRFVPGMGIAPTEKDATDLKTLRGTVENARSGINRLLEISNITGKSLSPSIRAEADAITQSLIGMLRVPITGPGAMSEGERKLLENLVANPTDMFSLDESNRVKLKSLMKRLDSSVDTMAKARGLGGVKSIEASMTPQQKAMLDWAKKNPGDKRADMIMKKLGVK